MPKLRSRTLPAGFIAPCLPTRAPCPPSGAIWLHEIKWDGFRVIARKEGKRVRLYNRPGNDLTRRFPLIVGVLAGLRSQFCIIDGEAGEAGRRRRIAGPTCGRIGRRTLTNGEHTGVDNGQESEESEVKDQEGEQGEQ